MSELPKEEWAPGPWHDEPDHVVFEHAGYPCILHRNLLGAWCGYVGVPEGHPWFGKGYDDVDANVHGGLTYAEPCQGDVCHEAPEPRHWLGFDCGHSQDRSPGLEATIAKIRSQPPQEKAWLAERMERLGMTVTYKDLAYVRAETESLAEQAAQAGMPRAKREGGST
jgi:hypothetical protein